MPDETSPEPGLAGHPGGRVADVNPRDPTRPLARFSRVDNEAVRLGGPLSVRMNTDAGPAEYIEVAQPWVFPDDPGTDIAITRFEPDVERFEVGQVTTASFLTPKLMDENAVGIGDEVMIIGLFTARTGRRRNLPTVRMGVIACMPDEPMEDRDTGNEYDAYLIEARSIGGLSGSPVFVMLGVDRPTWLDEDRSRDTLTIRWSMCLLGIIRGHYDRDLVSALDVSKGELEQINMGIAEVTPINEVAALIDRKDLRDERRRLEHAHQGFTTTLD
jgi:hypothetical protein